MKFVFFIVCFSLSALSLPIKAQVLIEQEFVNDMDRFDWIAFSDRENARKQIEFENEIFELLGPDSVIIGLNLGKSDLIRLEQELELYRRDIKTGLSPERIKVAQEVIALHWAGIRRIEAQIKAHSGLISEASTGQATNGDLEEYYKGVWKLHEGDHKVVFNMVEKTDKPLYEALGANDEVYAEFITPYVQRQMEKIEDTAKAYWSSLQSSYSGQKELNNLDVAYLIELYMNSLEIYNCFNKNFTNRLETHQKSLMDAIENWHTHQALLGANSLIQTYNTYGDASNPRAVVSELLGFYEAPESVQDRIISFLRNDIFYSKQYIQTEDRTRLGARVLALIGLNSFDVATPEEQNLFNKSIEQGIIKYRNPHNFFGRSRPLPEI